MDLLTNAIIEIANQKTSQDCFGMSIAGLPDFDYKGLAQGIHTSKQLELYFLGFDREAMLSLQQKLVATEQRRFYYTVEEAEESRNQGMEDTCRLLIIKNQELEKLSSLRWYEEINMEQVYRRSCIIVEKRLKACTSTNDAIDNLLKALRRRDIISILNFERVIRYLSALLEAEPTSLPNTVIEKLYLLGLCHENDFCAAPCTVDDFRKRIKANFDLVGRISRLEQKERSNIAAFSAKHPGNAIVEAILDYYQSADERLLYRMERKEIEDILKSVRLASTQKAPSKIKNNGGASPTVGGAQLIFDDNDELIDELLEDALEKIDNREDTDKRTTALLQAGDIKVSIPVEPVTEALAERSEGRVPYGGILLADVANPKDALEDFEKYDCDPFDDAYITEIHRVLEKAHTLLPEERVSSAFVKLLQARAQVSNHTKRLQDMPMLQVISEYRGFKEYLAAYEFLLSVIREDYSKLSELDSDEIKRVISRIIALDTLFIIGRENTHAIPMPCNPLYLWKYIKLAEEILESRGLTEGSDCYLSEKDKAFVLRKAEEIPDPLTLIMLPKKLTTAECLPLAGRIGCLPIYSTKPQISDSNAGMELVKQGIMRYMCLYPHSSMMLRICFINPPSVEAIVNMLKSLDRDKEFSSFGSVGIDLTIFRTKEAPSSWVELEDKSLNDGMLGRVRGKRNSTFNLSIVNKELSYDEVLKQLSREQHFLVIFDPNEKAVEAARNNRNIHIHPLCVPKVYEYKKLSGKVSIRPANEGELFADYASIVEKLYNQPSAFGHRNVFDVSPITEATYKQLLDKTDWLMLLDQGLKSWDICLRSTSEKLYYKGYDYRSAGIYSKNSKKFVMGYKDIIKQCGNYIPSEEGVLNIIDIIRIINEDGLLSIASHSANQIFDLRHGKGSLGLAIAAIKYKAHYPDSILVGLDTQLAREWLSDREDGRLPDLVGLRLEDEYEPRIDIIEVKTYAEGAYRIESGAISGPAVEQAAILEELLKEIFGSTERLTTVSRREILREQVFESVFCSDFEPERKQSLCEWLNKLFAGQLSVEINKSVCHVDFNASVSHCQKYNGADMFGDTTFILDIIGQPEIQKILTSTFTVQSTCEEKVPSNSETIAEDMNGAIAPDASVSTDSLPDIASEHEVAPTTASTLSVGGYTQDDTELQEKCIRLNMVLKSYGI
ncbi:hypothetical protein LJC63_10460, partial [Ruminococcaceae bacterium OttesenSCG-928-L11]|nr:hypothetical protein [Ruminococcaceae bacterium OttesenSCG-928-L11]